MFDNREMYRKLHAKKGLVPFTITVKETNLNIQADTDLTEKAIRSALTHRQYIETHIQNHPEFAKSMAPLPDPAVAPKIITEMTLAGQITGVGPMAAVAGAVSQAVGNDLLANTKEVLVENGGDIFVKSKTETIFTIFAGESPFSMKTGIRISARPGSFAMCTSSGTIGHSKSFGRADAVSILADSCAVADAAATALCNQVKTADDIEKTIAKGKQMEGIQGIVIILGAQIGLWGDLELIRL
ncbi:MAG: UPF0280 family protein [Desulfobacterales bacterium]|nr:UPF0280 family protein [Desulfobacterales bacterium]